MCGKKKRGGLHVCGEKVIRVASIASSGYVLSLKTVLLWKRMYIHAYKTVLV